MAKPQWSPAQIDQVVALRKAGHSWRKIQSSTGIPQSTCRRICSVHGDYVPQQPEPEPEIIESTAAPAPVVEQPAAQAPSQSPDDPISFRHAKLAELEQDIMQTRQRGQMQVLPTLHRLHINLHDEIRQMRADLDETADMSPDELLNSIVAAVHSLPPLLRHQFDQQLQAHNVVQFKKAEESTG
jgi:hypothetical protein